jgi:hypothetical protein
MVGNAHPTSFITLGFVHNHIWNKDFFAGGTSRCKKRRERPSIGINKGRASCRPIPEPKRSQRHETQYRFLASSGCRHFYHCEPYALPRRAIMKLRRTFEDHNCDFPGNGESDQNRKNLSGKPNSTDVQRPSSETTHEGLFEDSKLLEFCEEMIKHFKPKYR